MRTIVFAFAAVMFVLACSSWVGDLIHVMTEALR
jgi:hypothetical protein